MEVGMAGGLARPAGIARCAKSSSKTGVGVEKVQFLPDSPTIGGHTSLFIELIFYRVY